METNKTSTLVTKLQKEKLLKKQRLHHASCIFFKQNHSTLFKLMIYQLFISDWVHSANESCPFKLVM